jgi:hypothetical protein
MVLIISVFSIFHLVGDGAFACSGDVGDEVPDVHHSTNW